jgi:hypothetical protein
MYQLMVFYLARPANQPTGTGVVVLCNNKGLTPMIWKVSSEVLDEPVASFSGHLNLVHVDNKVTKGRTLVEYIGTLHCATNRKVAGSIADGVIGIFH